MRKPILLIDESVSEADLTLRALRNCGLQTPVLWAIDEAEALDVIARRAAAHGSEEAIGLIFLEIKLACDGFEVLKRLKSHPGSAHIPISIVTRSASPRDRTRAQLLGADGFVTKTTEIEEFSKILDAVMAPYRGT